MKTGGDNCTLVSNEIDFETEELLVGSKVCVKWSQNTLWWFAHLQQFITGTTKANQLSSYPVEVPLIPPAMNVYLHY